MKKLLGLTLTLASIGFAAPAEAQAAGANLSRSESAVTYAAAPQWRRANRRPRLRTYSRFVRVGRRVYRETYQIRYLPNGGTRTRLLSRVRVR